MSAVALTRQHFSRPNLRRLTSIELRKASDTRAGVWLLGLVTLATVAAALGRALAGVDAERHCRTCCRSR